MQDRLGQEVAVSDPVLVAVGGGLWPATVYELRPAANQIIAQLLEFSDEFVTSGPSGVVKVPYATLLSGPDAPRYVSRVKEVGNA